MKKHILGIVSIFIGVVIISVIILNHYSKKNDQNSIQPTTNSNSNNSQTIENKANKNSDNGEILTPETAQKPFTVKTEDGTDLIIVNKKHPLPKSYNPGINSDAQKNLQQLIKNAQKSGDKYASKITFNTSNFRSYSYQETLYNGYVSRNGKQNADTFSARPGYSEHQTGLAFDLMSDGNLYRIDDPNYNYSNDWLYLNAPKYGFIVRYKDETQKITGYKGEPWHLRYLGKDLAQNVSNSGKTLEEYFNISGGDYS